MSLFGGPSNCPICDRSLVPEQGEGWRLVGGARPTDWFLTHCRSDHQDYLAWKKSKNRLTVFLSITTIIILDLLLSYAFYNFGIRLPGRTGGGLLVLIAFPAFLIWRPVVNGFGIRRFRRVASERGFARTHDPNIGMASREMMGENLANFRSTS